MQVELTRDQAELLAGAAEYVLENAGTNGPQYCIVGIVDALTALRDAIATDDAAQHVINNAAWR